MFTIFLGPMMICLTKDYQTYLSFVHRLVREILGFAQYLHVYGTDNEDALVNALAAGFRGSFHLLRYIHCKKNVQQEMKQTGLSEGLTRRFCSDLFGRGGLVWSQSETDLKKRYRILLKTGIHLRGVSAKESPNSLHTSWKTRSKI